MKVKAPVKAAIGEVPFDPVVFAATVPARKPTPKDLADAKERPDEAIEPKDHATMGDMVRLLTSAATVRLSRPAQRKLMR